MIVLTKREIEREGPGNKVGDEPIRIIGLEGMEEGPHVPNERPAQITWRK